MLVDVLAVAHHFYHVTVEQVEGVAVALVIFSADSSEGEPARLATRYDGRRQVPVRAVLGVAVELARRVFSGGIQVAQSAKVGAQPMLCV